MNMLKVLFCAVLAATLLFISGCNTETQGQLQHYLEPTATHSDFIKPTAIVETGSIDFEWTSDAHWGIKSGKLEFTIDNARITTTVPSDGGFYGGWVTLFKGNESLDYEYPDYIMDEREFIDGVYLALVDVKVYSDNAIGYTKQDSDHHGIPKGEYNDPYLFSAQVIGFFTDMSIEYIEEKHHSFYSTNANYYSKLNNYPEHPFLFRIEPGETVTFTLGVVVGAKEKGGINDVTMLRFTTNTGGIGGQHLDMALSLPG